MAEYNWWDDRTVEDNDEHFCPVLNDICYSDDVNCQKCEVSKAFKADYKEGILSNIIDKFEKERERAEYEKIIESGDKRALAHFKLKHNYCMSPDEQALVDEDRVNKEYNEALKGIKSYAEKKDPCEGLTCYMLNDDGSYMK